MYSPSPRALHLHRERAEINTASSRVIEGEGQPLASTLLLPFTPGMNWLTANSAYLSPQRRG